MLALTQVLTLAALTTRLAQIDGEVKPPDVVYVPTPDAVVSTMLDLANVTSNDVVYDLGCGDGRIVVTAAVRHGARGVGVDVDPERIAESRANVSAAHVGDLVEIRQADLFEVDLRPATVVTLYLLPELNEKLRPRLFEQLRPGTRVVSHDFDMGAWEPDRVVEVSPGSTVYYWTIPAQAAGSWQLQGGGSLELEQEFQRLRGSLTRDGVTREIREARLDGEKLAISFYGDDQVYTGSVRGDELALDMGGELVTGERTGPEPGTLTPEEKGLGR